MIVVEESPAYRMWLTRRRAWSVLIGVHILFAVVAPLLTILNAAGPIVADTRLSLALALVLLMLQADNSAAAVAGRRPHGWPWTFGLLIAIVYVPMYWYNYGWASTQWFIVASGAMLLRGRLAGVIVGAPIIVTVVVTMVVILQDGFGWGTAIYGGFYWFTGMALVGASLYGAVEMVRTLDALHATRVELADAAVDRERQRVSRDLHDLLGQTLTAVSLKGDLAIAQLATDPAAAGAEIDNLIVTAEEAVEAIRQVTQGEHRPHLQTELDGAASLLAAAGVHADIDVAVGELPRAVEEVLGWAIREGVTNLLRHSRATTCAIVARVEDGRVCLEIVNDGVTELAAHGLGQGLSGVAERVVAVHGEMSSEFSRDHRHHLVVQVPVAA